MAYLEANFRAPAAPDEGMKALSPGVGSGANMSGSCKARREKDNTKATQTTETPPLSDRKASGSMPPKTSDVAPVPRSRCSVSRCVEPPILVNVFAFAKPLVADAVFANGMDRVRLDPPMDHLWLGRRFPRNEQHSPSRSWANPARSLPLEIT